ncbi:DHH family phosphoesterase [bacterium]|nr:DHH family phosphoesterase [bacterium]
MVNDEKVFVWCDADLDGASSYLILSWCYGKHLPVRSTTVKKFGADFTQWAKHTNTAQYDKIFILDIDVANTGAIDQADLDNVVIIDHHRTHVAKRDEYKKASAIIKETSSCSKLVWQIYTSITKDLPDEQRYMALLADDYDSYELKLPHSYDLNIVYWSLQGDRITKFYENYIKGFRSFTGYEKNIISLYKKKFEHIKKTTRPFKCFLHIKDKPVKFIAATADACINELADHLIKKYKSDVGVIINLNTQRFSLRKSDSCDVDLSELINKIGSGGGHEYAAGGVIDDKFLTFSKLLIPAK